MRLTRKLRRQLEKMSTLRWSYLVLAVVGVGCFSAFAFLPNLLEGWRAFLLNVGTEVLGIWLVIALIDTIIRRREDQQRKRYRSIALRQLWRPLKRYLTVLFNIYKASADGKPDRNISTVKDLFDGDYMEQLKRFDIAR
jgi:amino acid permease